TDTDAMTRGCPDEQVRCRPAVTAERDLRDHGASRISAEAGYLDVEEPAFSAENDRGEAQAIERYGDGGELFGIRHRDPSDDVRRRVCSHHGDESDMIVGRDELCFGLRRRPRRQRIGPYDRTAVAVV